MYTTNREIGDQIRVGDAVIEILDIKRGQVRLGITAPPSVPIRRLEILPEPVSPDDRELTNGR